MIGLLPLLASAAPVLDDVVDLDASSATCAVRRDGTVWCWGAGFLGGPTATIARLAVPVPGLRDIAQVRTGGEPWCALSRSGTVTCWGTFYVLGPVVPGPDARPRVMPGVQGASEITLGRSHACALVDGEARCWGGNSRRQLGRSRLLDGVLSNAPSAEPVAIELPGTARRIAAAADHTCAIIDDAEPLWCWGAGKEPNPWKLPADVVPVELSAGSGTTCVLDDQHRQTCLDLPDPYGGDRPRTALDRLPEVTLQDLGPLDYDIGLPTAALRVRGGRLEQARRRSQRNPRPLEYAPVPFGGTARKLVIGDAHACLLDDAGAVSCWGSSENGRLGADTEDVFRVVASVVAEDVGAFAVTPGAWCAVVDGALTCQGAEIEGAVRLDRADEIVFAGTGLCGRRGRRVRCLPGDRPGQPIDLDARGWRDLVGTPLAVCGVDGAHTLRCAGALDRVMGTAAPPTLAFRDVDSVAFSNLDSGCVVVGGGLRCFGRSARGGPGSFAPAASLLDTWSQPVHLVSDPGGEPVVPTGVLAGEDWLCVRTPTGLACARAPSWLFEDEGEDFRITPLPAAAVRDVAVTDSIGCAVDGGGDVRCADFRTVDRLRTGAPPEVRRVAGLSRVEALVLVGTHAEASGCARRDDGALLCWTEPWTSGSSADSPEPVRMQP